MRGIFVRERDGGENDDMQGLSRRTRDPCRSKIICNNQQDGWMRDYMAHIYMINIIRIESQIKNKKPRKN